MSGCADRRQVVRGGPGWTNQFPRCSSICWSFSFNMFIILNSILRWPFNVRAYTINCTKLKFNVIYVEQNVDKLLSHT